LDLTASIAHVASASEDIVAFKGHEAVARELFCVAETAERLGARIGGS
jgi:hypothetical protein